MPVTTESPGDSHQRQTRSGSAGSLQLTEFKKITKESEERILNTILGRFEALTYKIEALDASIKEVQSVQNKHASEIADIKKDISEVCHLKQKVLDQETVLQRIQKDMPDLIMLNMEKTSDEIESRILRRNNVILAGVNQSPSGNLHERQCDDRKICEEIVEFLGSPKGEILDIQRVGQTANTLIKIKFKSFETKQNVIRNARKLRSSPQFEKIFVNPDRTPLQQQQNKILRRELRDRRENGEDVIIRRGAVVQRDAKEVFHRHF